MKKILLAHSPDADDIFMYFAIKFGFGLDKGGHYSLDFWGRIFCIKKRGSVSLLTHSNEPIN